MFSDILKRITKLKLKSLRLNGRNFVKKKLPLRLHRLKRVKKERMMWKRRKLMILRWIQVENQLQRVILNQLELGGLIRNFE
jgi:hypothetical protein